jgi:hypothetical protein
LTRTLHCKHAILTDVQTAHWCVAPSVRSRITINENWKTYTEVKKKKKKEK